MPTMPPNAPHIRLISELTAKLSPGCILPFATDATIHITNMYISADRIPVSHPLPEVPFAAKNPPAAMATYVTTATAVSA